MQDEKFKTLEDFSGEIEKLAVVLKRKSNCINFSLTGGGNKGDDAKEEAKSGVIHSLSRSLRQLRALECNLQNILVLISSADKGGSSDE
jgi:hypothetical protein